MDKRRETILVEAAVGGDIESFGILCEWYYASMVAVAYSVISDHQLAEDAAQETFAQALTNLRKLKDKSRFGYWLAAICRNVAKDMVTAKARQVNSESASQVQRDYDDDGNDVAIRRAIGELPQRAKELVVLRYYDGLSYDEISAVLGISKGTINGRLTRAKQKLAEQLRRNGFLESQS